MVKREAHQNSEGRCGDEPVHPGNIDTKLGADEVYGNHVLRSRRFDTDVPNAVDLCNGDHEHAGKAAFKRYAEGADHAENDGHEAGHTCCCAGDEEAEDKAAADNAYDNVIRFCTEL